MASIPFVLEKANILPQLESILDCRIVYKGKYHPKNEIVVKWGGASTKNATWENERETLCLVPDIPDQAISDAARAAGYDGLIICSQASNMVDEDNIICTLYSQMGSRQIQPPSMSLSLLSNTGTLLTFSDIGYEPIINSTCQNLSLDQFRFSNLPGVMDV
ncbi:hypothetical protein SADUNF_Sadunf18G0042800 [Salix dunnii]|uniref:Chromo domain-containing protein n=1 Tax=Salix dunnii TaxID=1413687 RepID=A0A835J3C7_9ROSI|nr:hypothetical protein SADUNF_Sadunf18G0042800 [Salix dunnii]